MYFDCETKKVNLSLIEYVYKDISYTLRIIEVSLGFYRSICYILKFCLTE